MLSEVKTMVHWRLWSLVLFLLAIGFPTLLLPATIASSHSALDQIVREKNSDAKPKMWPGMWLWDRAGKFHGHVSTDGRPESGVGGLIYFLQDEDAGIRECATGWLGAMGQTAQPAIPSLKKLYGDPDAQVRKAAVDAVKRIKTRKPKS
ncbi:MAG: HEAT repeat domain-containing protein [Gemmataceae bacterium]